MTNDEIMQYATALHEADDETRLCRVPDVDPSRGGWLKIVIALKMLEGKQYFFSSDNSISIDAARRFAQDIGAVVIDVPAAAHPILGVLDDDRRAILIDPASGGVQ